MKVHETTSTSLQQPGPRALVAGPGRRRPPGTGTTRGTGSNNIGLRVVAVHASSMQTLRVSENPRVLLDEFRPCRKWTALCLRCHCPEAKTREMARPGPGPLLSALSLLGRGTERDGHIAVRPGPCACNTALGSGRPPPSPPRGGPGRRSGGLPPRPQQPPDLRSQIAGVLILAGSKQLHLIAQQQRLPQAG